MSEETEEVEARDNGNPGTPGAGDRTETEVEGSNASARGTVGPAAEIEDATDSFLELESEFDAESLPGRVRGQAVDVERIPTSVVPGDYPVEIETEGALALSVAVDGERVPVYFAFDESLSDTRLGRLLELKDVAPDRFADLYGESVLLTVEDGHHVPVVPEAAPRGSPLGAYGVGAGLAVNLLVLALLVVGLGGFFSVPVVFAWLAANVVGVPAATYFDAWYLRTHTDWDGGPLFWTALGAIPGLNAVSAGVYLYQRSTAADL